MAFMVGVYNMVVFNTASCRSLAFSIVGMLSARRRRRRERIISLSVYCPRNLKPKKKVP